jgi:hypothetical protein
VCNSSTSPSTRTPAKDAEAAQASSHLGREKGATPNDGAPRQQGMRMALWSDGQLVIQRGETVITFDV